LYAAYDFRAPGLDPARGHRPSRRPRLRRRSWICSGPPSSHQLSNQGAIGHLPVDTMR